MFDLSLDVDANGYISTDELNALFKEANLPLPGYRVREIITEISTTMDLNQDGKITFDEFAKVRLISHYYTFQKLYISVMKLCVCVSGGPWSEGLTGCKDLPESN